MTFFVTKKLMPALRRDSFLGGLLSFFVWQIMEVEKKLKCGGSWEFPASERRCSATDGVTDEKRR